MKQLKIWRSLLAALASIGLTACAADAPTSPKVSGQASSGLITELADGLVSKDALVRKNALPQDITVKAVIGKDGGTIAIPEAGFYVTIPAGAVKDETEFTVTALKASWSRTSSARTASRSRRPCRHARTSRLRTGDCCRSSHSSPATS
jgi:hypothetical protein